MSKTTATAYEVGHLYEVGPGTLKIGANVRSDPRPDAKEFAASIKTRGVREVISAYVDPDGGLTVLRGQRRSLVAAKVGTPTGTVPVRVVPAPEEADRIIDQASENLHREAMHTRETRDAVEQLAMLGVSAAQIAKRVALPRATVDAALNVTRNPVTKDRMDATGMTLEEAAIFAEFEDDPDAIETLTAAWEDSWRRRQIPHIVQRLRDERAEARALQAEVDRLRAEGLPVLDPGEVPADLHRHAMTNLRTVDGGVVPEETWPTVTGAAVAVSVEWVQADGPETDDEDEDDEPEDRQVYVPVWVCTDPAAANLHYVPAAGREYSDTTSGLSDEQSAAHSAEEEARREAESAERRRVIANNKAWKAAEVVRRQWLTGLLARRTVPAGTEALIARAVVGREYTLSHAMEHGHEVLLTLLGVVPVEREAASYYGNRSMCAQVLDQATTPKAALMRTLAAVVAAWEQRADTHTWRNPTEWDDTIMTALIGWGYPASDVERLLLRSDSAEAAR
jgi:ParB family chromosome partitioning protein